MGRTQKTLIIIRNKKVQFAESRYDSLLFGLVSNIRWHFLSLLQPFCLGFSQILAVGFTI